jgi:hypothetical protein
MHRRVFTLTGACLFLFSCLSAHGQTSPGEPSCHPQKASEDKDPVAILELGAATSWNLSGGAATFAPNLAAEITPIENWLELEAGVSPFTLVIRRNGTLTCSSRNRGPYRGRQSSCWASVLNGFTSRQNGKVANSIAGEVAGDFMFWPTGKHRFGWFLEPAYDYSFARGHQQSIGMSGGLLVGIR